MPDDPTPEKPRLDRRPYSKPTLRRINLEELPWPWWRRPQAELDPSLCLELQYREERRN